MESIYEQRVRGRDDGSIALLRARSVTVNVAWTRTQPPFLMPFTDPRADVDVSKNMASGARSVEPLYNLYWHRLCRECW